MLLTTLEVEMHFPSVEDGELVARLRLGTLALTVCLVGCSSDPGASDDASILDSGGIPDARLVDAAADAEPPWVLYANNPVLVDDPGSAWMNIIADPWVMKDGSVYKMWFAARVDTKDDTGETEIGYATSSDGISWSIHPTPVVQAGGTGQWDDSSAETPTVVKRPDGVYEMWYSGFELLGDYGGADAAEFYRHLFKIGHATSPDGISWTKDPANPVLDIDLVGQIGPDWLAVADPSVTYEAGTYCMYYTGVDSVVGKLQLHISLATSTDGSAWTRHPSNPVLSLGPPGSWDSTLVAQPGVFKVGSGYVMVYAGNDAPGAGDTVAPEVGSLGIATSMDGIVWQRAMEPMIEKQPGTWNELAAWGATGLFANDEIKVWFGGARLTDRIETAFGLATQQHSMP